MIGKSGERRLVAITCTTRYCFPFIYDKFIKRGVTKLVIAHENILAVAMLGKIFETQRNLNFHRFQIADVKNTIVAFACNSLDDTVILTDSHRIFQYDVYSENVTVLRDAHANSTVGYVDVDDLGGNIYRTDDKGTMLVMSIATGQEVTLLSDLGKMCGIKVVSGRGDKLKTFHLSCFRK